MTAPTPRTQAFRTVDILKIIAAQCIVLHHFSAYGPLSTAAAESAPSVSDWLFDDARIAVQVFLVIAGYLLARGLALNRPSPGLLQAVGRRYLRLVVPFGVALVLTIVCTELARPALDGDPVLSSAPKLNQLLAHISLLHSVLDVESLSAGVWYVAIDFQLYATMALLIWIGRGQRTLNLALVSLLTTASLVWFNLDTSLDIWAPYYFGAYGLGALAWWAGLRARHSLLALGLYVATVSAGLASLAVEFRVRIALAISVSVALSTLGTYPLKLPRAVDRWIGRLSRTSYALFLVHFSVLLMANAVWATLDPDDADWVWVFLAASWATAHLVSYVFHTQVELRFEAWRTNVRTTELLASK